jgi:light-regulated signal transduction histidine kinase (bacteriophytochrome)
LRSRSAAQDVTDRVRLSNALKAQAEELQGANDQLRRINRELDDFTYVVSHDLKEPLRTVQVFGNFLALDCAAQLGAEGQEYIAHMVTASKRLGHLIDDLLTLSRAGRVLNTVQVFDLGQTVSTVRSDLASLIQRKGASVQADEKLPLVLGDPQRITQLLSNLVSNGLKYNTNPSPTVAIGVGKAAIDGQRHVVISVRDNGIGIDPQYHEQIFGIFRRLHLPEEYEGTGAGLAICKKIVEAHGGRIWVESEPGQGATFYFTLARPGPTGNGLAGTGKDTMVLRGKRGTGAPA